MKTFLLIVSVFVLVVLMCYLGFKKSNNSFTHQKADTMETYLRYFDTVKVDGSNHVAEHFVIRHRFDTLIGDNYQRYINYYVPIDSTINSLSKIDSINHVTDPKYWTGPKKVVRIFALLPQDWVLYDYNKSHNLFVGKPTDVK